MWQGNFIVKLIYYNFVCPLADSQLVIMHLSQAAVKLSLGSLI